MTAADAATLGRIMCLNYAIIGLLLLVILMLWRRG